MAAAGTADKRRLSAAEVNESLSRLHHRREGEYGMSLEAIEKVTQIEQQSQERKAAAEAEARRIVAEAEREGLAL